MAYENGDQYYDVSPLCPIIPSTWLTYLQLPVFQHLMSEWLSENETATPRLPSHPMVEPLEINTTSGDPTVEFVKCIPSPQAHSFSRLRRSSISANGPKTPTPSANGGGVAGGSGSGGGGPQLDCSIGSAKKVRVCLYCWELPAFLWD